MKNCVIFDIHKPLEYNENDCIFVKTDWIVSFFQRNLTKPYILVTGDSDYSPSTFFSDSELFSILEKPECIEWRSQNVCFSHPKMKHLPIGFENDPVKLEFYEKHKERLISIPKQNLVYKNFTIQNNPLERSCFYSSHSTIPFEDYMYEMASYKYVLCPMGNGIDTHRFWEAQLCGCIPIIRCPKEFLPTYEGYKYICIPGKCYARLGHPNVVREFESVFVQNGLNLF